MTDEARDKDKDDDAPKPHAHAPKARAHKGKGPAPTVLIQDGDLTVTLHSDGDGEEHHAVVEFGGGKTARVTVEPDDNIWRATLGDITRTGSHPDTAVTMCVWAAREAGVLAAPAEGGE